MSITSDSTIAVAGAGTMGTGIVQVLLQAGHKVCWYDANTESLKRASESLGKTFELLEAKGKISSGSGKNLLQKLVLLESAELLKGQIFIEAIIENAEAKKNLFQIVAKANPADTILCSNTSSIYITSIASAIPHPERIAGLHFFNPAPLMKLVEVIAGAATSEATVETLFNWINSIGKVAVKAEDHPGFIVNRLARPYYTESLRIVAENAAMPQQVDRLLESCGFKMGPFKLMDLIGNDINFEVTKSLYKAFHGEARYRPSAIQEQKVAAGHLGKKTGKGFYDYT
jgi:3-hydroxybutyryl-CoA dehydrogenase